MNLLKKIIPSDEREAEERYERIRDDAIHKVNKDVSGVAKEVSNQIAPTDFIAAMYAPTERKSEPVASGETASFKDQMTLKPGELLGDVTGNPEQPGQKAETASALGQVTIPAPEILGAMMGSPVGPEENTSTESGIEQVLPTAGQLIGHATGSIQTERVTPHMESAGQQIIPQLDEAAGLLGVTTSEAGHSSQPTHQQPPSESHKQSGNSEQQPPEMSQMAQQHSAQKAELDRAGIDPEMQMNQQERATLSQEQKEKREHMSLHDRNYRKFGTPLDPIGSLEEQVSKVRQQKEQEEKQKLQEEEEEKKRKEEEEKQQQQELEMPGGKPKQGEPVAVNQAKKKTEVHRGASG